MRKTEKGVGTTVQRVCRVVVDRVNSSNKQIYDQILLVPILKSNSYFPNGGGFPDHGCENESESKLVVDACVSQYT